MDLTDLFSIIIVHEGKLFDSDIYSFGAKMQNSIKDMTQRSKTEERDMKLTTVAIFIKILESDRPQRSSLSKDFTSCNQIIYIYIYIYFLSFFSCGGLHIYIYMYVFCFYFY